MQLEAILAAINAINATLPAAAGLVLSLKHSDGTESVLSALDKDEARNDLNIEQAQAFIDAHKTDPT